MPRHVPQRTCVICRETKAKKELVRIVATAESTIAVDLTGKKAGRGAYLCRNRECWVTAINRPKRLESALKSQGIADEAMGEVRTFAESLKTPETIASDGGLY